MKNVLRWIAVPLVAILFAYLASFVGELFARLNFTGFGNNNWLDQLLYWLSKGLFQGAGIVYGGALVAPKNKGIVSIVIATLWISLCVLVVFITFSDQTWYKLVYYVSGIVSAVLVAQYYVGLDKDKELFAKTVKPTAPKTPIKKEEEKDYDKLFCDYYNAGLSSLQYKIDLSYGSSKRFIEEIGEHKKDYLQYAKNRFYKELPKFPYAWGKKLVVNMASEEDGKVEGKITGIDLLNWKYNVVFDKDVSLIHLDDDFDNAMPEKKHLLTSTQIDEILSGRLVGTFLHFHC